VKDVLWVAGILFLIFPGMVFWRLPLIGGLNLAARLAIAFAGGLAIVTLLLYLYNFAHIPWTRTTVGIPLIALGVFGFRRANLKWDSRGPLSCTLILIFVALTIYGVATARQTCGDLIFFWGPKGQRFHYAGKIDTDFLGYNHYYLMHHDYPPLLPLAYAWASLVAHRFSWWGALFFTPIALLAMTAAFRGLAAPAVGEDRARWYAVLLAAIVGYGFAIGMVAGAAEPPLLLFEVIAIAALTFAGDERDAQILAAIALAAVAVTKVEGAAFVVITVAAFLIVTRKAVRSALIALPAVALLASWILFCWRHNLLDSYGRAKSAMHLELFGQTLRATLRQASYDVAYVPWIATLAPLAITRRIRRATLPLIVAAGTLASVLFFYLHADNPSWWIEASAQRVLLTPLVCLVVASAAASE
jgi:hypothetical protein